MNVEQEKRLAAEAAAELVEDGMIVGLGTRVLARRRLSISCVATSPRTMRAASGLVGWDVFAAVLSPGDVILLMSWRDHAAAEAFEGALALPEGARLRRVRVVRDYGMFDRREAPQYYPEVRRAEAARS